MCSNIIPFSPYVGLYPPQPTDQDASEKEGENTPSKFDLSTPPMRDTQVTDIFYEDTVTSSPLEITNFPPTVSVPVVPGEALFWLPLLFSHILYLF